jgi:hypothetical protein
MYVLRNVPDRDHAWLVINLVWGWLDGFIARGEAEYEMTGLVDDPAALLDRMKGESGGRTFGETL